MGTTAPRKVPRDRAVAVMGWIVTALLVTPLAWTTIPPLSDYPNHLVRVHLLGRLAEGASVGPWSARWAALPNLAVDVFGVALEPLLGLSGFARFFLAMTIVVHALGCRALSKSILGRPSMRAVVVSAFVWSEPLLLGYASFAFGFALSLHALARVVCVLDPEQAKTRRRDVMVASILGLGVAASHAAAAATLVAATFAFVAARAARARDGGPKGAPPRVDRLAVLALAALVPCLLYVGAWWVRHASSGGVSLATPGMIARALVSTMTSLEPRLDQLSLAAIAILAGAALWHLRPLELRGGPLAAAAALGLLVAVFPSDVAGGIEVHGRFALGLWTLAPFAFDARDGAEGPTRRRIDAVGRIAIALFVVRTAVLAKNLRDVDREAQEIRALFAEEVPEGATVGVAWFFPAVKDAGSLGAGRLSAAERVRALATLHIPTLAILDRRAEVPTLYDLPGAQPIHYDGVLPRKHRYAADAPPPRAVDLLAVFDVVWLCGGPAELRIDLAIRAKLIGKVGRCVLYRRNAVADIASSAASIAPSSSATSSSAASCSAASLPFTLVSSMRASTRRKTSAMRTPSFDAGSTLRSPSTVLTRATAGASDAASAASAVFSLSFTRASDSLS